MTNLKFAREEDGALLVFFAICAAAIFLIASLSFDLGQRASTQSELQSFADNVALAAAGELNGFPGAIERSERAANALIRDNFVFGVEADGGGDANKTLQGEADFDLFFYATLPPDDKTAMSTVVPLPRNSASDSTARFVRVVVKDVNVDWDFANLLTIFSDDPLPSEAVNAEAVAGYTSLQCDIAPVFFCLPDDEDEWTPTTDIGNTILLKAGPQSGGPGGPWWEPGNFTWLNVIEQAEAAWTKDGVVKPQGPCAEFAKNLNGKFNPDLYECLFSAGTGLLCFFNGGLDTKPGGTEGVITAVFNTRFDIFGKGSGSNQTEEIFSPAPVVTTGLDASTTCGSSTKPTDTTMGLPADDCFTGHGGCADGVYDGTVRYGNGDWSEGRLFYADVNYSFDADSVGLPFSEDNLNLVDSANVIINGPDDLTNPLVIKDELIKIDGEVYHRYDPMRPDSLDYPKPERYKDYPVVPNGASQWEYYQAEVAASLYLNPQSVMTTDSDDRITLDSALAKIATPNNEADFELIRDILDVDGNIIYDRLGASLANCNDTIVPDPRRRTLVAAAIDCSEDGRNGGINGYTKDIEAEFFLDIFLLSSSGTMRNTATGSTPGNPNADKEIYVQIIGPALNTGEFTRDPGRFRNLVQLYR